MARRIPVSLAFSSTVTLKPVSASALEMARASRTGFLSGELLYAELPITSATRRSPAGAGLTGAICSARSCADAATATHDRSNTPILRNPFRTCDTPRGKVYPSFRIAAMTPFSWTNPYPWPRKPVLAQNIVATSQPLAAQAGLQMLAAGGNAVDAILATAITLTLVEPVSNGIGSDAFAIVWDGEQLHGLNASGRSPAGWTPEFFAGQKAMPVRGWNAVTRAGLRLGVGRAARRSSASCPSSELFEAAIRYGRDGFLVSPTIAGQWAKQVPELKAQPGFARGLHAGGPRAAAGRALPLPGARRDAGEDRGDARRGVLPRRARRADRGARASSTAARCARRDLAAHRSDWVEPLQMDYRGYTLHEIPPNGQGIVALMALGILAALRPARAPGRRRRQPAPADRGA